MVTIYSFLFIYHAINSWQSHNIQNQIIKFVYQVLRMLPSSAPWLTRPRTPWVWYAAPAMEAGWCRGYTWRSGSIFFLKLKKIEHQKSQFPSSIVPLFHYNQILNWLHFWVWKNIDPVWRFGYWTRKQEPEAASAWQTSPGGWTPLAQILSWTLTCRRSRMCTSPSQSCLLTPSLTLSTMPPIKRGKVPRSIWQCSHFPW